MPLVSIGVSRTVLVPICAIIAISTELIAVAVAGGAKVIAGSLACIRIAACHFLV